ncbi:MAG: DUF2235 domain-containing protein [Gammaproteobacteria bacterium]
METARSGRNIVVLSDGTGNSSAKANKTNVWRLFQALDQTQSDQIARYDDGVGTSSNKYLAAFGGAFGWGLKRNVIDLYKFICRNWQPGDAIHGFGFSRGAFTIRVLIGFIAREGLVPYQSEDELHRNAVSAYRCYRSKAFPANGKPLVRACRSLRDAFVRLRDWIRGYPSYDAITRIAESQHRRDVPIRFLGLWDTVEAYGVPIVGLKRAIDRWLWPLVFGDFKLSPKVEQARHALSLDDERTTFHPLLWDDLAEATAGRAGRIRQVWFAGVHSNVGGGYPEDQLSLVPLGWIMDEALKNGLRLDPAAVRDVRVNQSPFAKLYDSRAGLNSYYRYSPRRIEVPIDPAGIPIFPVIHRSVLVRMTQGTDSYAPFTLPHQFWILDTDDQLVPLSPKPAEMKLDASKPPGITLDSSDPDVATAIQKLARPDRQAIRLVWDTVFWRRCLYALTVSLTILLVIYPVIAAPVASAMTWLTGIDRATRGPVADIVNAFSALIPSYVAPWKNALNEHPLEFFLILIAILGSLAGSVTLERRIRDRARMAWDRQFRDGYLGWLRESRKAWRNGLTVLFAVSMAGVALAIFYKPMRYALWALSALAAGTLLIQGFRLLGSVQRKDAASRTKIQSTFSLSLARVLRTSAPLRAGFGFLTDHFAPAAFVVVLLLGALLLLNRATFDLTSAAGRFCHGTTSDFTKDAAVARASGFDTADMCWASGIVLKKGRRYEITIDTPGDWFDRQLQTDVLGMPSEGVRHIMAAPLKRWWSENWFQPVMRIGDVGNVESPLEPVDDIAPALPPRCEASNEVVARLGVSDKLPRSEAERVMACNPVPADRKILRARITAEADGELFLFVNDAVLSVPGVTETFMKNNSGTASVEVRRLGLRASAAQ